MSLTDLLSNWNEHCWLGMALEISEAAAFGNGLAIVVGGRDVADFGCGGEFGFLRACEGDERGFRLDFDECSVAIQHSTVGPYAYAQIVVKCFSPNSPCCANVPARDREGR